jgi:hypothetical protein
MGVCSAPGHGAVSRRSAAAARPQTALAKPHSSIRFPPAHTLPLPRPPPAAQIFALKHGDPGSSDRWVSGNAIYFRMNRILDIYFVGGFGTVQVRLCVDVREGMCGWVGRGHCRCAREPRRPPGRLLSHPGHGLTSLPPFPVLQWVDVDEYTAAQPDQIAVLNPIHTLQARNQGGKEGGAPAGPAAEATVFSPPAAPSPSPNTHPVLPPVNANPLRRC